MSRCNDKTYAGVLGGVGIWTPDDLTSCVISVEGHVWTVSVNNSMIYTLVYKSSDGWSVKVYDSDYWLIRSWKHSRRCNGINQLVVRKDSVFVPDGDSSIIIQYSFTGEVERRIPCLTLKCTHTRLSVRSSPCDAVIVSCSDTVCCIDMSTGDCVWSTDSMEEPTAVCCDNADRVYVAVGGYSDTIQITVLDGDTGKAMLHNYHLPVTAFNFFLEARSFHISYN